MANAKEYLEEVTKLSKRLMTETEALLPFERTATLQLRAAANAVQLDITLMSELLSGLEQRSESTESSIGTHKDDYNSARQKLVSTLNAVLSDAQLGTIAKLLRSTSREQHPPVVKMIQVAFKDVETARRGFEIAFKAYWLPAFIANTTSKPTPEINVREDSPQVQKLLQSFRMAPFAVGGSADPFMEGTPDDRDEVIALKSYRMRVEEAGVSWVQTQSKQPTLEQLTAAQIAAITLIWGGGVETVAKVDAIAFNQQEADFSEVQATRTDLSNKLRDSVLRHKSSHFSMVFVGTESAGKSTFINAFLGVQVLPTGEGPTTSYPVRIRHIPGQTEPSMSLGVETLNGNLGKLRRGQWYSRISSMLDPKRNDRSRKAPWEGKDLPPGFDFERLRTRWRGLGRATAARLGELTAGESMFAESVHGAQNVLKTLKDINDFVRICRNLPIGFDHFAPEEWPVISLEFPSLRDVYTAPNLEGIGGSNAEWDEMLQQILRAAKSIIAIVSLRQFGSQTWEGLPEFIARGTNIRASAVIVTMRDSAPILQEELKSRLRYIRSTFWPHIDEDVAKDSLFLCSTTEGTTMEVMKQFLANLKELPPWEVLWAPPLQAASHKLFAGRFEDSYREHTIETLRDATEQVLTRSGLPAAINALMQMLNTAQKQSLFRESDGIITQSKRIAFDLRRMLTAVGKAQGDVETPTSAEDRRVSNYTMELLDTWESRSDEFICGVRSMVVAASQGIAVEVEKCVSDTMLRAWCKFKQAPVPPLLDSIDFKQLDDANRYMLFYEESLKECLPTVVQERWKGILQSIHQLHEVGFSTLRDKVAEIDPSVREYWSGSFADHEMPSSKLPLVTKQALLDNVQENRSRYSAVRGFRSLEGRILQKLSNSQRIDEQLSKLGVISKCVLALVSTLPFLLTLPYWLRQTYVESYRLDLASSRQTLRDLAQAHSSDILGHIEEEASVYERLELEVATNAISSSFLIPEGYSATEALPNVSPSQLQMVTSALANLIAFNSAIGWIRESVERIE